MAVVSRLTPDIEETLGNESLRNQLVETGHAVDAQRPRTTSHAVVQRRRPALDPKGVLIPRIDNPGQNPIGLVVDSQTARRTSEIGGGEETLSKTGNRVPIEYSVGVGHNHQQVLHV